VRASALRVLPVAEEVVQAAGGAREDPVEVGAEAGLGSDAGSGSGSAVERLDPPEDGKPVDFSLNGSKDASFAATAMDMRWLSDPWALGPGRVWMRLRHPLVPGRKATPLARLAATADFCNGVSAALRFDRFLFINADLTIHLQRLPQGEWIGLDARTELRGGGPALAEGVLHDRHGPVGRAFQSLVVQGRWLSQGRGA
jgi:Thioesterase-like superfamily